jgi:hypothetical protein
MAGRRTSWGDLSPEYRARLERKGITAQSHGSGASIKSARGHDKSPEHMRDAIANPDRYRDWWKRVGNNQVYGNREELQRRAIRALNASTLPTEHGISARERIEYNGHAPADSSGHKFTTQGWHPLNNRQLTVLGAFKGNDWQRMASWANKNIPKGDKAAMAAFGWLLYH